jgi:hypothetical protein
VKEPLVVMTRIHTTARAKKKGPMPFKRAMSKWTDHAAPTPAAKMAILMAMSQRFLSVMLE